MKVHASTELSRMMTLQRHSSETRGALERAGQEMSTGIKASQYKATGGDLTRLYSLERLLERNGTHTYIIGLTETRLEVMQFGLGQAQKAAATIAVDMLAATGLNDVTSARTHAEASARAFQDLVGTLNGSVAGASLYSGTSTDSTALLPAEDILAEIFGEVAPLDALAAVERVQDYFDVEGLEDPNFFRDAYTGSNDPLTAAEVGDGVRVNYAIRATDEKLVQALKAHALGALVATGGPLADADPVEQLAILNAAGQELLEARDGLLELSIRTGGAQAAIEGAKVQRNAERESYELARTRIVAADPYDSATVFEAMKSQLENIYTVTARIASLRFTNFMG